MKSIKFDFKMTNKAAAVSLLLVLLLLKVKSQTLPAPGTSYSVTSTVGTTCGVGSSYCATDAAERRVTQEVSSSASPVTTAAPAVTSISENVTQLSQELTSPTKQKSFSTSTTPHPPVDLIKPLKPNYEQLAGYAKTGTCACDLMAFSCDINCCCDQECTTHNRVAFSACETQGYPVYDNRYCFSTKLIFLNNSEYILQQTQNSAFCIVRSNLAASVLYPSRTTFTTHQEFAKQWGRTQSLSWPVLSLPKSLPADRPTPYVAGALMLILKDNEVQYLEFPSSGLTSACTSKKSVLYLQPWSTHCFRKAPSTKKECDLVSSDIYRHLNFIVRSPLLVNYTQLLSREIGPCSTEICTPATFFVCPDLATDNIQNCKNISVESIQSGLHSGMCFGVVKKLKLFLYHNGTEGLKYLEAYMWLSNMSLAKSIDTLHQTVSVSFKWSIPKEYTKEILPSNTTSAQNSTSKMLSIPFLRSGNPGYIVGKPVLAGFRIPKKSSVNETKDAQAETQSSKVQRNLIQLSNDPNQWLTLPGSASEGKCDWSHTQRHVVTFGEDLHMSCGIRVFPSNVSSQFSCNNFRGEMLRLLLGDASYTFFNSSYASDWGRVIGVYGNANASAPQDWIPFLLDNQTPPILLPMNPDTEAQDDASTAFTNHPVQTCESVPLGTEVRILHAFVGPTSNPQSKIIGASLRFSPVQDVALNCPSALCFKGSEALNLRVVSTVQFVDVSSPAVTRFAEPPAIHIRLPPDFFYPFMATEDSSSTSIHFMPVCLVLSFVISMFSCCQ